MLGAWGKKKTEAEWKKDLTSANVFIAPALADFLEVRTDFTRVHD